MLVVENPREENQGRDQHGLMALSLVSRSRKVADE